MYQSVLYSACWELVATTGAFTIILSFFIDGHIAITLAVSGKHATSGMLFTADE